MAVSHNPAIWATLAVGLLLLPTGLAQVASEATFEAAATSWTGASPGANGFFAGLTVVDSLEQNSNPSDSTFEIRAQQATVETDFAEAFLQAGVLTSPVPPPLPLASAPGMKSTEASYTNVTVAGTASRASRFLYVMPVEERNIGIEGDCASAEASPNAQLTAIAMVNSSRGDRVSDSSRALRVQACLGSELTLHGSFVVVLWEWDCQLAADEGEVDLWSGKGQPDNAANQDTRPYLSRAQQVYLTIHDGTFTVRGNEERPPLLYVDDLQLDGVPNFVLTQASGQVKGVELPVTGGQVELSGQMGLALHRSESGVRVQVYDGMETLEVDGRTIELATSMTQSPGDQFPLWGIIGLAGAVLAAPILVVPRLLHRRKEGQVDVEVEEVVDQVEKLVGSLCYADALPASARLLELAPRHPQANFLRATVLRRTGFTREALAQHERVRTLGVLAEFQPAWASVLGLEAARAAVDVAASVQGPERSLWQRKALEHLDKAAAADRTILSELDAHPELGELYWNRSRVS